MKNLLVVILLMGPLAWGEESNPQIADAEKAKIPSVHNAAKSTSNSNRFAQIVATATGVAMITEGVTLMVHNCHPKGNAARCTKGAALVGQGGLAHVQARHHGNTASQSDNSSGQTWGHGNLYDTEGYGDGKPVDESDVYRQFVGQAVDDAKKKGSQATFDKKTNKINLPDGRSVGPKDVLSNSALSNLGLSAADIASINSEVAKAQAKAQENIKTVVPSFGHESGGGGGAFGAAATASLESENAWNMPSQDRMPSSLDIKSETAGLTKDYHGEPIGVANDSIFMMMSRRYQLKNKQDAFFGSR